MKSFQCNKLACCMRAQTVGDVSLNCYCDCNEIASGMQCKLCTADAKAHAKLVRCLAVGWHHCFRPVDAVAARPAMCATAHRHAAGSNDWVTTLATGCATRRRRPASTQPQVRAPRPTSKLGGILAAPAVAARKPHSTILLETNGYARPQCGPSGHIPDATAKRVTDQLLFEHGRARLLEMQRLAQEQAAAKQSRHKQPDPQAAMVDQVSRLAA